MDDDTLPAPPAQTIEVCYRHPDVQTRVHCTRCGRPICPDCMIPAPVGFQCPECVEKARREFRQGPGRPFRGGFSPTRVLLILIVVPFVFEVVRGGPQTLFQNPPARVLFEMGAMYPPAVASGQFWRLFTAMFLHANLLHLAFNAYALWLFGRAVEEEFGRANMVAIYFVTGFLASAASYAFGPIDALAVGASGAIFGIFGAFVAYNYRRRHLAVHSAQLRSAAMLLLLNAVLAIAYGAIDWRAHLGGLIAGFVAGYVAEGFGPPGRRRFVRAAGFAALIAVGVALVVWRTNEIRELFGLDELLG
ncbi:MAG TPA: rhomboid family intramembrane serine protease [Actinomycetota bacterium]|nr:rhomboid family intramembrane serine protease [Actinomycetota bacterium]